MSTTGEATCAAVDIVWARGMTHSPTCQAGQAEGFHAAEFMHAAHDHRRAVDESVPEGLAIRLGVDGMKQQMTIVDLP